MRSRRNFQFSNFLLFSIEAHCSIKERRRLVLREELRRRGETEAQIYRQCRGMSVVEGRCGGWQVRWLDVRGRINIRRQQDNLKQVSSLFHICNLFFFVGLRFVKLLFAHLTFKSSNSNLTILFCFFFILIFSSYFLFQGSLVFLWLLDFKAQYF